MLGRHGGKHDDGQGGQTGNYDLVGSLMYACHSTQEMLGRRGKYKRSLEDGQVFT